MNEPIRIERVPNEDEIFRWLFEPPKVYNDAKELLWLEIFRFPSGRGGCESVVWFRYAKTMRVVHRLACDREKALLREGKSKKYLGALTGNVGQIRRVRSQNGHGFTVSHEPSEGPHHAHICYAPRAGSTLDSLTKNDKKELRYSLGKVFGGNLDRHTCPPEKTSGRGRVYLILRAFVSHLRAALHRRAAPSGAR